jgi:hypothetical protein
MLQDGPLNSKETLRDGPLPEGKELPRGENEQLKDTRLAQAAVLRSETREIPVMDSFASVAAEANTKSGTAARSEEATKYNEVIMKDARELFYNQAVGAGTPGEDALAAITQVEADGALQQSREDFPIRKYVDAISSPDLSAQDREDLGTVLYLQDKLNEFTQGISGWDTVKDVGLSVLIGPKDLFDTWQLTGAVSPWEQENQYRKFAVWFQELPNDQKIELFPAIQEHFVKALPEHRAADFLTGLLDPAAINDIGAELSIFGALDAALLGAGTVATSFKLRKLFNPLKAASRAGDTERAAETNFAIMENPGSGETLDLDDWQINTNALPFLGEKLDDAVASELSPAVHERIYAFRDRMIQSFQDLSDAKTFTREGFLDTQDQARAERRLYDEYDFYVKKTFAGEDKMINLDDVGAIPGGAEFRFTVTNDDGTITKATWQGQFTLDDVGFWQSAPKKSAIFSELKQANKTDFMSTVKAAIRLDNTAATVSSQLGKVIKDASKPVKGFRGKPRKTRVDEVDQILISGDDMGKEFTPRELRGGVGGIKLDEDQIEYYYNLRGVMNGLGILRNIDARRAMVTRGVKNIQVNDSTRFFGTPIETAAIAAERLKGNPKIWKFDETGQAVDVENLNLNDLYDQGFRVTKLEQDEILGGNLYGFVLSKTDQLGELPHVVLDLKKGYVPRVNPDATYFVQRFTKSTLNGAPHVLRKALRSFDTQKAADKFASEQFAARGVDDTDTTFHVVADGELEAFKAGDSGATQTGGLIYSPRARTPVPHNDGPASLTPRTSALESVELYLENTKNYMTRNDWRMGLRKKWENTAKFKLGKTVTFEEGENIANLELKTLYDKINNFSGFMDKSERAWEETVKGVFEWSIEKFGRNRVSDFILTQRQKDPLARLRAATFHTLLGSFNPVQLWVQAQGAATAMAMNILNPVKLQRMFRQQNALAMLQHVNFDDSPKILSKMAKGFGYESVDEMKQMDTLWKKSGFHDSVLSSADVEAAARGFPTTKGAVKRFFDSGLGFFRAGELFNRRLAFLTAIDELGGPAKLASSDKLFKEALDRTNGLILNLGKANRAAWQKGFLSIPTQFLQIQAKTIESILGLNGVLTTGEAGKLLMGQFALYGAAGAFGGQWALRAGAALTGQDQIDINNMDEGWLRAMTGGFTDWFAFQMGANIIASDRGALLNGMDQTFLSLFTEESTAFEWFAGPSSVGPERIWQKMRQLGHMFPIPQDINGNVSFEAQDVSDTLAFILRGMGELAVSPFATTSQVTKSLLMNDLGSIRDKNGNLVASPTGGFNWQTEWATAFGFKPELLQRKFDLSEINEETRKYVEFRSNMLVMNFDTFLQEHQSSLEDERDIDEDTLRQFRKRQNVLLNSITDPGVRQRVLDSFNNRLRNRDQSQLDRQSQVYYDNMLLDVFGTYTSTDTRLIQTRDTE